MVIDSGRPALLSKVDQMWLRCFSFRYYEPAHDPNQSEDEERERRLQEFEDEIMEIAAVIRPWALPKPALAGSRGAGEKPPRTLPAGCCYVVGSKPAFAA